MWIDIHAHLYDRSEDILRLTLENAIKNGVATIINTSTSIETAELVSNQCEKFKNLYGTVGISPFDTIQVSENWDIKLKNLFKQKKIVGLGEIGLDSTNPIYPSQEKQIPIFEQQLQIAKDLNKPVIIHSRGSEKKIINFCKNQKIIKALFHCFTGDKDSLREILNSGYYISFSGIITFKNNLLKDLVEFTPLNRLFIETDTPYLTPHPYRGKKNEPAYVFYVGEKIAQIKKLPPDKVKKQIQLNFSKLFDLSLSNQ